MRYSERLIDNALIFREVVTIVSYVMTCLPSFGIDVESEQFGEMYHWVTEETR